MMCMRRWAAAPIVTLTLMLTVMLGVSLTSGCVVQDDLRDGIKEMNTSVTAWQLDRSGDGSGELSFTLHYELGVVDEAGVEALQWTYQLHPVSGPPVAEHSQQMRKPEPDKTQILVQGDRKRTLEIEGGLEAGGIYILHFYIYYREELLEELLLKVTEGEQLIAEDVPGDVTLSDPGMPIPPGEPI